MTSVPTTMLPLDRQIAASIDSVSRALAEWTVSLLYDQRPEFTEIYGESGRALWKGEILNRMQYLAEAIAADRSAIFTHSVEWARAGFIARGFDTNHLEFSLKALEDTLGAELPGPAAARAVRMIRDGIDAARRADRSDNDSVLESALGNKGVDTERARSYLVHLLERQQSKAVDVLVSAVQGGRSVAEVYESVIEPALVEVGRLWHINEATVADEHYVTTATQNAMAVLRMKLPHAQPNGKRALATSIGGDLHDVGIRMVADLLESDGWQVDCLGANMPTTDLVEHSVDEVGRPQFDLFALSASTGLMVRTAAGAIEALRNASPDHHLPIMVGGGPFRIVPDLWRIVGADGCANRASEAVRLARQLMMQRDR